MDRRIRELVILRADRRCEYCRLPQAAEPLITFHVEHVVARQHLGPDDETNLALACHHCNLHKGPNLAGIDPATGVLTPLFHPRHDVWDEHFEFRGGLIVGLTAVGRTTIQVVDLNAEDRVRLREAWLNFEEPG